MFDFNAASAVEIPSATSKASVFESTALESARTIIDTEPETLDPTNLTETEVNVEAAVAIDASVTP